MRKLIMILTLTISYLGATAVASAYGPQTPTCDPWGDPSSCTVR
jgi:hypothetical protein